MRWRSARGGCWRRSGSGGGLAPRAQAIEEIKISDGRAGEGAARLFLHFDQHEIDEGPMGHILEDRYLRAALAAAMAAAPLVEAPRRRRRWSARRRRRAGVSVTLADGTHARAARCSSPATGATARWRARAGIRRRGWDYGQTSLVCARGARAAAPRHRAPVLHAGGAARHPAAAGRTARRSSGPRRPARAAAISALDEAGYLAELRPALRRLPRRDRGSRARATPIRSACRWRSALTGAAAGAGRRRGARHPPAGGAGPEPRAARRGDAGRGGGGGRAAAARTSARRTCWRPTRAGGASTSRRWRRRPTGSTGCSRTTIRCFASVATSVSALVNRLPALRRALIGEAAGLSGDLPRAAARPAALGYDATSMVESS